MKLFLDTETTGLDRYYDRVLQLCMILTDDDYNILETYNGRFKVDMAGQLRVTDEALNYIHITRNFYEKHHIHTLEECKMPIVEMLSKTNFVFYGYNYSFDRDILKSNLERANCPLPMLSGIEVMRKRKKLQIAIEEKFDVNSILDYTRYYFNDAVGFHDATFDTVCTMLLAKQLGI